MQQGLRRLQLVGRFDPGARLDGGSPYLGGWGHQLADYPLSAVQKGAEAETQGKGGAAA